MIQSGLGVLLRINNDSSVQKFVKLRRSGEVQKESKQTVQCVSLNLKKKLADAGLNCYSIRYVIFSYVF